MKKKNTGFFDKTPAVASVSLTNRLKQAQKTGFLNLTGLSLNMLPVELNNFQELKLIENWWEAYPLLKLDCSNNLFENIPPEISIHLVIFRSFYNSRI